MLPSTAANRILVAMTLFLLSSAAAAQIPVSGAWPPPLPSLPSPADLAGVQLDHQTWSSDDGQDWIIKAEQPNGIDFYLSRQACERWIAHGKRSAINALKLNGEPVRLARCHDGVNLASLPVPQLSAKAYEMLLFSGSFE